jgi:hypothetical protein
MDKVEIAQEYRRRAVELEFEREWVAHTPQNPPQACLLYDGLGTGLDIQPGLSFEARNYLEMFFIHNFRELGLGAVTWNDTRAEDVHDVTALLEKVAAWVEETVDD